MLRAGELVYEGVGFFDVDGYFLGCPVKGEVRCSSMPSRANELKVVGAGGSQLARVARHATRRVICHELIT